jgi:hypothetical protein
MTHRPGSWEGLPPVRLRGLVKGASSTVGVAPMGGPRTNQTYAWWLEVLLESCGLPAEIHNAGIEGQPIQRALCNWDTEVQQWSPDVVVLNYGQYECMPGLLPHWLERHATGWHHHNSPIRDRYRLQFFMPAWRKVVRYQMKVDEYVNSGPFRASPKRTIIELSRLTEQIKTVGTPLVIVMDTWPLSGRWAHWFPGMPRRIEIMRNAIVDWVESTNDPNIRLFRVSEIVKRHDLEEALPDGVHFSSGLHREIAEELAREVLSWAVTQPHLQHPNIRLPGRATLTSVPTCDTPGGRPSGLLQGFQTDDRVAEK